MVNVIGLGYIGLPTALMLASHGVQVVGTDYNTKLVQTLQAGQTTFSEAGLEALFASALEAGIRFSGEYQSTDVYIVSVPTPYDRDSKKIDPCYVIAAVKQILSVCAEDAVIVIESTVSPGTMDRFVRPLCQGKKVHLVHAPERIIPGNMLYELEHNSRTIGADDPQVGQQVKELYSSFCKGEIVVTDIKTAEMTKVIENTYRAVNIAFANELAKLCHYEGMNVDEIIRICNMHPRVNILSPGPGVGGHCIPVDPWFLVGDYPEHTPLIAKAMTINEEMPDFIYSRICSIMEEHGISDFSKVGLYGLTYKEDVDDVRESPTLQLLQRHPMPFAVYDPMLTETIADNQYTDFTNFLQDTHLVVVMVAHSHLRSVSEAMKDKIIFDTRRALKGMDTYRI
ncbi:MAG: nucleotide sugar dehydrogenase [Oscillospiraceae bacterium]|nr:nucleotide sugar dehydrogenase [Oscillospiraceae bacterium]